MWGNFSEHGDANMMKDSKAKFRKMFAELPDCMTGSAADDAQTAEDLISVCRTQLDLIEEGQDGTEDDDPDAIRAWLEKWE
jgi:hypothetical protein